MKIQLILGLLILILASYSLILPENDHLLLPTMNVIIALLILVMGLSTLRDNHKNVGIFLLGTSGLLFIVTIAKLLLS